MVSPIDYVDMLKAYMGFVDNRAPELAFRSGDRPRHATSFDASSRSVRKEVQAETITEAIIVSIENRCMGNSDIERSYGGADGNETDLHAFLQ